MKTYTLQNSRGVTVQCIAYGATLAEWHVPDRDGNFDDVVLGFDNLADYQSEKNQSFGCTAGRVANRIAGGRFTLDDQEYALAINNGPNHLHGGVERCLSKVIWEAEQHDQNGAPAVIFRYTSSDGEEGYPGTLQLTVTYTLHDDDALHIDYLAVSDKPTPVNLTNHTYFNLSGAGRESIADHLLAIHADHYTRTDDTLIPTGEIVPVADTPLDFRTPQTIGSRIEELLDTPWNGYDHNYVLNEADNTLRPAASVYDPLSGRTLRVRTTQPGVQLYSGNYLAGHTGKQGKTYPGRCAFCLETQHFPNSVNVPSFPSTIVRPGETYRHSCIYQITAD